MEPQPPRPTRAAARTTPLELLNEPPINPPWQGLRATAARGFRVNPDGHRTIVPFRRESVTSVAVSRIKALKKAAHTVGVGVRSLQNSTTVRFVPDGAFPDEPFRTPACLPAATHVNDATALRRPSRPLQKGLQTRATIIEAALALAANKGLEGLSIGLLAETTGMSKSGVFAHFGSREGLQISVVREYHAKFEEEVFNPSMRDARGLPRLRGLFDRWVRRVAVEIDSGCIYISGAVEFDDRPGPVRDALVTMVQTWQAALERAIRIAIDEGHLRADTDPQQMLFEVHGLILALHHDARFLRHPGAVERARTAFERVLGYYTSLPDSVGSPRRRASSV
jgi:AcrR family transcriptional regulator